MILLTLVMCLGFLTKPSSSFLDYSTYYLLINDYQQNFTSPKQIEFYQNLIDENSHYLHFADSERKRLKELCREMFQLGYDNYMKHAFPADELDPIHCRGRGPDRDHPENININDVLGDYMLTLVDSLDSLAVFGNASEFKKAAKIVVDNLNFDKDSTVQVFEATIRVLGSLLSAHLIITDDKQPFGDMTLENYDNELLHLAHDLAARLLQTFVNDGTDLPYPRVNLRNGVPQNTFNYTCTSGAGSLLLEFGVLSALIKDPVYEKVARRSIESLFSRRDKNTGLLGNEIHVLSGEWLGFTCGLGAGLDSFYEYLMKSYVLFGTSSDLLMFEELYASLKSKLRRGRSMCNSGYGHHPIYVNVDMRTANLINSWVDSLQAFFAGLQVLSGDLEEAICSHALYYAIWQKFGLLPERYNWNMKLPDVLFYPLRPEFAESNYFLYQATKSPFYLHVAKEIIENLNKYTKVRCGFATVHDVLDKSLEDRMESFFLSETLKYLYLTFDTDNYLNNDGALDYVFSTEGHLFPIKRIRKLRESLETEDEHHKELNISSKGYKTIAHSMPMQVKYLSQLFDMVGVNDNVEKLLDRKSK